MLCLALNEEWQQPSILRRKGHKTVRFHLIHFSVHENIKNLQKMIIIISWEKKNDLAWKAESFRRS